MKRFFTLSCFFAIVSIGYSQQLPMFTQYREYRSIINPAAITGGYLNHEHNFSAGVSYRSQWTEISSAPRTAVLHGEYMTTDYEPFNLIVGGSILHDQTGPTGFTGIYGRIGGLLSGDPYYGGISAGITIGAVQYRVNASELRVREENDILAMTDQNKVFPDVGLGVFAYTLLEGGWFDEDHLYGGISIPQAIGLDLEFQGEDGTFSTKRVQHFYGTVGLYKYLNDDSFLEPSVWVKYAPNAPVNVDVNLRYQLSFNFWVGAGYSTANAMHLETGVVLGDNVSHQNNLRIGYGFDHSFTSFGPFAGSTHEINIAYSFQTN